MRHKLFSIRPAATLRGRKFKGLGGWAGKPTHPPLTDVPVAAYVMVGVFDLVLVGGWFGRGLRPRCLHRRDLDHHRRWDRVAEPR